MRGLGVALLLKPSLLVLLTLQMTFSLKFFTRWNLS